MVVHCRFSNDAFGPETDHFPTILRNHAESAEMPAYQQLLVIPSHGDPVIEEIRLLVNGNREEICIENRMGNTYRSSVPVEIGTPAIMRGIRVLPIKVYPGRIDPASGSVDLINECSISLSFTDGSGTNAVNQPNRSTGRDFLRLSEAVLLDSPAPPRDDNTPYGGAYLYLIPDADGVEEALEPLIEWRLRSGCLVEVQTVAGDQNSIMDAIQEAYDEWEMPPEYVVLVGEAEGNDALAPWQETDPVTDYNYTLVDGDDFLPDLAIGRLSWESLDDLQQMASKIVEYESAPDIEEDWLDHAVSCTATNDVQSSQITVCRWVYQQMLDAGYDDVDTSYTQVNAQFVDFLVDQINDGTSLISSRSLSGWADADFDRLNNNHQWPLLILCSGNSGRFWRNNENDDGAEMFMRELDGAVGAIGGSNDRTRTAYANLFAGSIIQGLLVENCQEFGWALNRAKLELYRQYNDYSDDPYDVDLEWWEAHAMMFNLMGDPGTRLWITTPGEMIVEFQADMSQGLNRLSVAVIRLEDENPIEGALICLYNPDGIFHTGFTDETGLYTFAIPHDEMELEGAFLTVTAEDYVPFLGEATFVPTEYSIGVSDIIVDDSEADDDGIPDNAETVNLFTTLYNYGQETPEGPLTVTLVDRSENYEIVAGEVEIEEVPEPGESIVIEDGLSILVNSNCPNDAEIRIDVNVTDADERIYRSSQFLITGAPCMSIGELRIDNGELAPGEDVELDIELVNQGNQLFGANAELISLNEVVFVDRANSEYDLIDPDDRAFLADNPFLVRISPQAIPGMKIRFELQLSSENEREETLLVEMQLVQADEGDPFGPDEYGYVCYDSGDQDWMLVPEFEWFELDPNLDGDGEELGFEDFGDVADQSVVIDLPFEFVYYGEGYRELTVCSNGWIAPGSQSQFSDSRNRMLPSPLGPRGMICVFWDNLTGDDASGIYGAYYENLGIFVIEWSSMRRQVDPGLGDQETFEILIFNPETHPTPTGDCELQFQYSEVTDSPDCYDWDTPYSTVGIEGYQDSQALQYCYWDSYSNGAARLEDDLAILYTTTLMASTGSVGGRVTNAANDEPLPDVDILLNIGLNTSSNENGEFLFEGLPSGARYTLTASLAGFNDFQSEEIEVPENDVALIDIAMLHPEFGISDQEITVAIEPGEQYHHELILTNDGNGQLEFSSEINLTEEPDFDEPWDLLLEINITEETGDEYLTSALWAAGYFWIAGATNNQNPNSLYRFDREGQYIDRLFQPTRDFWGVRGMAFDGNHIWSYSDEGVIEIDLDGSMVSSFEGPHENGRGIAWSPDSRTLYLAGISGANEDTVYEVDTEGNILRALPTTYEIYGLSWLADDPDGAPLYLTARAEVGGQVEIVKMNLETAEEIPVRQISRENGDRAAGSEIAGTWQMDRWVLVTIIANPRGDRLEVYELAPRATWIAMEPTEGVVDPEDDLAISLDFNTEGTDEIDSRAEIIFTHNAIGGEFRLPVLMHVEPDMISSDDIIPHDFTTNTAFPNPFNSTTRIDFYLPDKREVIAKLIDLNGRSVMNINRGELSIGWHNIQMEANQLTSGVYIFQLTAGDVIKRQKIVVLR